MVAIAVLGATGFTGRELVALALQDGHTVYALARSPERVVAGLPIQLTAEQEKRLVLVKGDIYQPESLEKAIMNADVVFECFGVTNNRPTTLKADAGRAICIAMRKHGRKRLVAITSEGINPKGLSFVPQFVRRFLVPFFFDNIFSDLAAMDNVIQGETWLDYTIFQPGQLVVAPSAGPTRVEPDGFNSWPLPFVDLARAMLDVGLAGTHKKVSNLGVVPPRQISVPNNADNRRNLSLVWDCVKFKILDKPEFRLAAAAAAAAAAAWLVVRRRG